MKLTYQKDCNRSRYLIQKRGLHDGDVTWEVRIGTVYHLYAAQDYMWFANGSPFMDIVLERDGSKIHATDGATGLPIPLNNRPKNYSDAMDEIMSISDMLYKVVVENWYQDIVHQCDRAKEELL